MDRIEKYARKNNIPIMQKEGIIFLEEYIKAHNFKTILEIGTAIGYSAIKMAMINPQIRVITIERDIDLYNEAINNIKDFNLTSQITIINDDALNVDIEDKFDLIFIDAAKAQYIKFFEKYSPRLNDKGVIISDNLNFHKLAENPEKIKSKNLRALVRKINDYKEFLKNNSQYKTIFLDIGDGISITRHITNSNK